MNLASYYKLSEISYALYESVSNNWVYPFDATKMIDIYDFIKYTVDTQKFDVTCPPGMAGGKYSCNPASNWLKP